MSFPYKHVLMVGATSGIGKAMADRLIESGVKVTAIGRRKDRLDEFVQRHGESMATAAVFDVGSTERAPKCAADIMGKFSDIDCIFLNAGVQSRFDLSQKIDLAAFFSEMNTNFNGLVALAQAFLPYLLEQKSQTSIIFTSSNLALLPASPLPAYCASKAALNVYTLCLRDHLRNTNVKVIDLSPPAVQTELHDYMGKEVGAKVGMPLADFTQAAYKGLLSGEDQIVIGAVGPAEVLNDIIPKRRAAFEKLAKLLRGVA